MTKIPTAQSSLAATFEVAWKKWGNRHLICEYVFAPDRKYAFDYASPPHMLAIEIDGGQHTYMGGRHNTDEDRRKCNLAESMGWHILHFSGTMLHDPEECCRVIKQAIAYLEFSTALAT